jgi:hypothetical protein
VFSYAKQQWNIGASIYGRHNFRVKWKTFIFTVRSYLNKSELDTLKAFFSTYDSGFNILDEQKDLWGVINRVCLYKSSTANERLHAIIDHFKVLKNTLEKDNIDSLYSSKQNGITLLSSNDLQVEATIKFIPGQQKEGLLSLLLTYEGHGLYHINFRFGKDHQGNSCIWVGTIQGYKDGLERAKKLTKKMHGYRPKNFIFFLLRQLATNMGIEYIYAVSDEGFFSNSHALRFHRHKLVTFNEFWEELGGQVWSEDARFFTIPIEEERKTYETAKTHKRNMYRKRYEMLDAFIEEIQHQGKSFLCDR